MKNLRKTFLYPNKIGFLSPVFDNFFISNQFGDKYVESLVFLNRNISLPKLTLENTEIVTIHL